MKREKGITLVALVITVIVLIILAAVSIKAVMNGGLIINAKTAKEKWETGETEETGKLASLLAEIRAKYVESKNGKVSLPNSTGTKLMDYKVSGNTVDGESVGEKTENLFNSNYMSVGSNYTLTITGGYKGVALQLKPNTTYTLNSKRTEKTDTPSASFWYKVNNTGTSGGSHIGSYNVNNGSYYFGKASVTTGDDGLLYIVYAGNIKNIYEYFNEFQLIEGTTLPDYEPYGYKIPVKVSGKNLFDKEKYLNSEYLETNNGYSIKEIQLSPNTTYKVSVIRRNDYSGTSAYVLINSVATVNTTGWSSIAHKTSPNISETNYMYTTDESGNLYIGEAGTSQEIEEVWNNTDLQIEKGTTGTDYEPYVESTTNIYLNEPLRKIEDKADYIDFKNQKIVRYIKEENGVLSLIENGPIEEAIELPQIPTFEEVTYVTIDTTVLPSKLEVNYESN